MWVPGIGPTNYFVSLATSTLIPLAVLPPLSLLPSGRTLCFFIMFIIYPVVVSTVFGTFNCQVFDDGSVFMFRDLSISCEGRAYQIAWVYAVVMAVIYTLGIPLLYVYVLYLEGPKLRRVRDIQELLMRQSVEQYTEKGNRIELHGTGRELAHEIFRTHHQFCGIELDLKHEFAIVKSVWPAYTLHADLSEPEEERAFANYQHAEGRRLLRRLQQRIPLSQAEHTRLQRLSMVLSDGCAWTPALCTFDSLEMSNAARKNTMLHAAHQLTVDSRSAPVAAAA